MKKNITLLLTLAFCVVFAQQTKVCKCFQLERIKDSIASHSVNKFFPISEEEALNPPYHFVSVEFINGQKSLEKKSHLKRPKLVKTVADIPSNLIIKQGELNDSKAILYADERFDFRSYYVRISKDNGKTWKNYFTGLIVNNNYFFTRNSQYPLWKDQDHLQIETDIRRMIKSAVLPDMQPVYETVKSNALITLDLNEITKDSDGDGINDIEEIKMLFTNPYSKDTDEDGINDSEDKNPRYRNPDNDFSKLWEGILYGYYEFIQKSDPVNEEFNINLTTFKEDMKKQREDLPSKRNNFMNSLRDKVIVTEDEYVRGIEPYDEKIIFMSLKEYSIYKTFTHSDWSDIFYSKMFQCDELPDTYVLLVNAETTGYTYLIKRTSSGWNIKVIDHWIA